jgi:hypothetical protein
MVSVLFCRADSAYKGDNRFDVWDAQRDALLFTGNNPVIAHPPCRAWGILSHMAKPRPGEKDLAPWAIGKVRENGGVLEHPKGSRLWKFLQLPEPDAMPDEFGGFSILIDQWDFGHVARKPTKLYICGLVGDLPPLPTARDGEPVKSITGSPPGRPYLKRCTQYEREYTPDALREFLFEVAQRCQPRRCS